MIVNGVTLPDIPAEVLEQYPYIFITHGESTLGTEAYTIIASATEFLHMSPDIFPDIEEGLYCLSDSKMIDYDSDEAAWNEDGSVLPVMTNLLFFQNAGIGTMTIVYSNYDIYTVASINADTEEFTKGEIYFPNSEAEEEPEETKPPRYSIATAILDAVARQIMRLTDSTAKVKPEEFEPKLEGINIQLQELTVTATEEVQTITPPSGVYGFSKVIVEAVEDSGTSGGGGTPGGGEGGDDTGPTISNGDNFAFGDNYIEQTVYTGMATYPTTNGDKKLPAPVGGEYKIISQSSGTYYLYTAPVKFYTTGRFDSPDTIDNSAINYFAATQNDSEWTYRGTWSVAGEPIWTSHDLYDRNNTVLYVPKSDNYTLESTTAIVPTPVECEDSYEVSSESLNSIVGTVQKLTNTTEPMTLTEVVEALSEYAEANGFT